LRNVSFSISRLPLEVNRSDPGPVFSTTPVLNRVRGTDPAFDGTPSIVRRICTGMKPQIA
jgi:hypothetical protein